MTKQEIAESLLKIKAVDLDAKKGFVYASGRKGPIYCDNRLILSYPAERDKIIEGFLYTIKEKNIVFDIVAGVATGGIAWAAILADRLKKPMVYIRAASKNHGKQNQIEGELEEGKRILIIEDLVNTGSSSVAACIALKEESCTVAACIAVFNYSLKDAAKLFTKEKIPLYSLTDFSSLIKTAADAKYINAEGKKILMEWQNNPKAWKPTLSGKD
ncbi:orotate phosphoribosyltransferase [Candidatus Woesearchaeota archaeon]|nr:orotate phosphoribosyltransferase [Candidatus Woesearchaeota archaeon]